MKIACVILAAGLGTRMKSGLPKVLHRVAGVPMLQIIVDAARRLRPERIVVVTGKNQQDLNRAIRGDDVTYALQEVPKGTGHALLSARDALQGFQGTVLVLNGDTPLIVPMTIRSFLQLHRKGGNAVSVLSFFAGDPAQYGRIVRDGRGGVTAIREQKDASDEETKIREVNSGVYAMEREALSLLTQISRNKKKGEYYLTDIVALSSQKGLRTAAYPVGDEDDFMGVNTRAELSRASLLLQSRIVAGWLESGVSFLAPESVFVHPEAVIGPETTIYPNVFIDGTTRIGAGCVIYPNVRIRNSRIGSGVIVKDCTVIEESVIRDRASVGPFAHVRPDSLIGSEAKVGNFVELKKARIGRGSKASHLSYLGDATIGRLVNIGAGTITCNYDGVRKSQTVIDDGVFIGSDSQLVAPVRIGRGAYVGAGSTITKNVPSHALALSRSRQVLIKGWARRRRRADQKKGAGKD